MAGKLTVAIIHPRVEQVINGRKHSSLHREIRLVSEEGGTVATLSHHGHHHAARLARCWNSHAELLAALKNLVESPTIHSEDMREARELIAKVEAML